MELVAQSVNDQPTRQTAAAKAVVSKSITRTGVATRFARSCGYVLTRTKWFARNWLECDVADRDTGEFRGTRWIYIKIGTRPKMVKEAPVITDADRYAA